MKRFTLILGILLIAVAYNLKAQENEKKGDTTKIRIGDKKILIIENDKVTTVKTDIDEDTTQINIEEIDSLGDIEEEELCGDKFKGNWRGFEFGLNNYITKEGDMINDDSDLALNQGKSWAFSLNLLQLSIPVIHDHFGIVTGLGFEWNNYSFDHDITLAPDTDMVVTNTGGIEFSKNKLKTTFLTAPLVLEYQTKVGNSNKKFFIGAGLICGIKLCSSTKQEWSSGNTDHEYVVQDNYNINSFRYGLTGRIGYGHFGLFANYNMTPLFKDNTTPIDLYPITVGIRLFGF